MCDGDVTTSNTKQTSTWVHFNDKTGKFEFQCPPELSPRHAFMFALAILNLISRPPTRM